MTVSDTAALNLWHLVTEPVTPVQDQLHANERHDHRQPGRQAH
jgi:hypothetical protein